MHKIRKVDVNIVEVDTNYKLGEQIINLMNDDDHNGNNGKEYLWKEAKGYKCNFDYISTIIDKNDVIDEDDETRINMALSELVDRIKVHDQNYYVFGESNIYQVDQNWIIALPFAHLN
jgi:hypothetical protein